MENVKELYGRQDIQRLKTKYRNEKLVFALVAALALGLCVFLCCLTDQKNAAVMEKAVVAVSVLAGWVEITLYHQLLQVRRAEIGHAQMLQEGERETLEGVLALSEERMRIRGSILFYPLTLSGEDGTHRSKVVASRAAVLRAENGKRLRLYTVNGYAAAFEEL